jgi:hypothetical protein
MRINNKRELQLRTNIAHNIESIERLKEFRTMEKEELCSKYKNLKDNYNQAADDKARYDFTMKNLEQQNVEMQYELDLLEHDKGKK